MSQDHGERLTALAHGERIAALESRMGGIERSNERMEQKLDAALKQQDAWKSTVGGAVLILGAIGWVASLFKDWILDHIR